MGDEGVHGHEETLPTLEEGTWHSTSSLRAGEAHSRWKVSALYRQRGTAAEGCGEPYTGANLGTLAAQPRHLAVQPPGAPRTLLDRPWATCLGRQAAVLKPGLQTTAMLPLTKLKAPLECPCHVRAGDLFLCEPDSAANIEPSHPHGSCTRTSDASRLVHRSRPLSRASAASLEPTGRAAVHRTGSTAAVTFSQPPGGPRLPTPPEEPWRGTGKTGSRQTRAAACERPRTNRRRLHDGRPRAG